MPTSLVAPRPSLVTFGSRLSGPKQAYLSAGTEYQDAILFHHNAARANHDARPLLWDPVAESNARIAARSCTFNHYLPPGIQEGQNLFAVSGNAFNVTAGIIESWYKNELPYMRGFFGAEDIPEDVFHRVGHLTQVLWKATNRIGCASINCGKNMKVDGNPSSSLNKYTVCNYIPAGNIAGRYADNVGTLVPRAKLGSWAD